MRIFTSFMILAILMQASQTTATKNDKVFSGVSIVNRNRTIQYLLNHLEQFNMYKPMILVTWFKYKSDSKIIMTNLFIQKNIDCI